MVIPTPRAGFGNPGSSTDSSPQAVRTGRVFDIKRFSTHDGPGIRSTVFLTGCPLRCAWCHNPEALSCSPSGNPNTRVLTVPDLIRELERDLPYYDSSGGGVTLSGGEPLVQSRFALDVLQTCRKRELHTALDTCGQVEPSLLLEAADMVDLILYDLKSMDSDSHHHCTGAANSRILENLQLLDQHGAKVWIRLPLIPGINDDARNLDSMIEFLATTRFRRISILPYHRIAEAKYQRLGIPNRMTGTEPPSHDRIEAVRSRFAHAGFDPHVGT